MRIVFYGFFAICALAFLPSCAPAFINNCPAWLEVGTIDIQENELDLIFDTEETSRWMFRYETNRLRECRD